MIDKILHFLIGHRWKTTKRSHTVHNPFRICKICGYHEVYVYGIGWISEEESRKYEPE